MPVDPYSVSGQKKPENQKKSIFGHFSHSAYLFTFYLVLQQKMCLVLTLKKTLCSVDLESYLYVLKYCLLILTQRLLTSIHLSLVS